MTQQFLKPMIIRAPPLPTAYLDVTPTTWSRHDVTPRHRRPPTQTSRDLPTCTASSSTVSVCRLPTHLHSVSPLRVLQRPRSQLLQQAGSRDQAPPGRAWMIGHHDDMRVSDNRGWGLEHHCCMLGVRGRKRKINISEAKRYDILLQTLKSLKILCREKKSLEDIIQ